MRGQFEPHLAPRARMLRRLSCHVTPTPAVGVAVALRLGGTKAKGKKVPVKRAAPKPLARAPVKPTKAVAKPTPKAVAKAPAATVAKAPAAPEPKATPKVTAAPKPVSAAAVAAPPAPPAAEDVAAGPPKRAPNALFLFANEHRAAVISEMRGPDGKGTVRIGQVMIRISGMFKALPAAERAAYIARSDALRAKFHAAKAAAPKGAGRRAPKAPKMRTGHVNPMFLFGKEPRAAILARMRGPDGTGKVKVGQVGAEIAKLWRALPESKREEWKAKADALRAEAKAKAPAAPAAASAGDPPGGDMPPMEPGPKRPLNPMFLFANDVRPGIMDKMRKASPDGKVSLGAIGAEVSAQWRKLSDDERKPYVKQWEDKRQAYAEAKKEHFQKRRAAIQAMPNAPKPKPRVGRPELPRVPVTTSGTESAAYQQFVQALIGDVQKASPGLPRRAVEEKLAEAWGVMSEAEKKPFFQLAASAAPATSAAPETPSTA